MAPRTITGGAAIDLNSTPLEATVRSFGVLDDAAAELDWGWPAPTCRMNLATGVDKFIKEVRDYPGRIKSLELFGA